MRLSTSSPCVNPEKDEVSALLGSARCDRRSFRLLIAEEKFPNFLRTYVYNAIEEALRRGAEVSVVAFGVMGDSEIPPAIASALRGKVFYARGNSRTGIASGLLKYLMPGTKASRENWRGLAVLARKYGHLRPWPWPWPKTVIKTIANAHLIAAGPFDLVHAHTPLVGLECSFLARAMAIPLLITFHGATVPGVPNPHPRKLKEAFLFATLVLVNTEFTRNWVQTLGCPPEKVRILRQGIVLQDFPFRTRTFPRDRRLILLSVGRLARDKGQSVAIEAVARLVAEGRDVEYRIVGVGPDRERLTQQIAQMGLEDRVRIIPGSDRTVVLKQFAEADLFVFPSISGQTILENTETQGVVVQEAQASGLVVVASRTGGIPECVDEERSAFLVKPGDPEALAHKIAYVLDQPEKWPEWQHNGRAWVEQNFSSEKMGTRLWELYAEACALYGRSFPFASSAA